MECMPHTTHESRRLLESLSGEALAEHQLARLNALLDQILPANRFYAEKFAGVKLPLESLNQLAELPLTYKDELIAAEHEGAFAANLTWPVQDYVRLHQTSGTKGRPLVVLDTAADWQWWIDCWQHVLDAAHISTDDTVLMAFSFGPFIGFWSAYDAVAARGALVVPGGGMNTLQRLELMRSIGATAVFCTPSYALHVAEVAEKHQINLAALDVRHLVVAGEPGGSIRSTRAKIEDAWQARVVDHAGASEIGPWGYGDADARGIHVLESEFIAEFLSIETGAPASEGELAELVITTLGRAGSPVIRYRTGDLVRPYREHDMECRFVLLEGGVLGRADDMLIIRGVNIFPSSIEQIIRSFPEIVEFRLTATRVAEMDQLLIEIEDRLHEPKRVAEELRLRLGLNVDVRSVDLGSLPRFEAKGRRFIDRRQAGD